MFAPSMGDIWRRASGRDTMSSWNSSSLSTVSNTDYVYLCLDRFSPRTITTLQNMDLEKIDLGLLVRVIKHISLQMEVHNKNS